MCNAYNHLVDCTCGFGGIGHAGRRRPGASTPHSFSSIFEFIPRITQTYESYVNPNAKCPKCGALVFFYQSPAGGRVFFDELGPPWPKHPCTDNSSIPVKLDTATILAMQGTRSLTFEWQRNGWSPFFVSVVSRIDGLTYQLKGEFQGDHLTIFVNEKLNRFGDAKVITNDIIAFLKKTRGEHYSISLITKSEWSVRASAFSSLIEARRNRNPARIRKSFPRELF